MSLHFSAGSTKNLSYMFISISPVNFTDRDIFHILFKSSSHLKEVGVFSTEIKKITIKSFGKSKDYN